MVDVALRRQPTARAPTSSTLRAHGVAAGDYLLLTAHRAGNVDDPARLRALVELVAALPGPVVFAASPAHARAAADAGLLARARGGRRACASDRAARLRASSARCCARRAPSLTDSGGVQKEAYLAGVPCVTLRANTEWVETVDRGWNTLVDLDAAGGAAGAGQARARRERPALYGDGHAARALRAGDRRAGGGQGDDRRPERSMRAEEP